MIIYMYVAHKRITFDTLLNNFPLKCTKYLITGLGMVPVVTHKIHLIIFAKQETLLLRIELITFSGISLYRIRKEYDWYSSTIPDSR